MNFLGASMFNGKRHWNEKIIISSVRSHCDDEECSCTAGVGRPGNQPQSREDPDGPYLNDNEYDDDMLMEVLGHSQQLDEPSTSQPQSTMPPLMFGTTISDSHCNRQS